MSGSGTITEIEKGKLYRVFLSAGKGPDGKYIRISETVHGSFRAAQGRLGALRASVDSGVYVARKAETVGDFIARWWPAKSTALAPTTVVCYRDLINGQILPAVGNRPLQRLTGPEISGMLTAIVGRGHTPRAVSSHGVLRLILRSAVKMGALGRNPMDGVPQPRPPYREMKILAPADWRRVREHLTSRESPWAPAFTLAITSGLRRSELAGLRWGDLAAETGILTVRRAIHKIQPGQIIVREPKTARSRRAVALDHGTLAVLAAHRAQVDKLAGMFGRTVQPTDYIFARADGTPWPPPAFSRAWRSLTASLSIRGVRFHDLRHSAASLMLAAGVPVQLVSARLGHASAGFTLTVYAHALPGAEVEAAEKLAAILNGPRRGPALALPAAAS
jgi:integrase